MLKKIALAVFVFTILAGPSFCAPPMTANNTLGLDMPTLGWLERNSDGKIVSNFGINYALGLSYRRYFEPLKTNSLNTYWALGTVFVILPYLGVGVDYVWDGGFYFGGGLFWIIPEIHGGFMF
jgi:hypothetical protein